VTTTLPPSLDGFIDKFFARVASGDIEIYNEFSLQHELGIQLGGLPGREVDRQPAD